MITIPLLSLLLAPAALAGPFRRDGFEGTCHVSKGDVSFPPGLDALTSDPSLVLLAVGNQNYTCNNGAFV
jgi:hypothetical protein